MKTILTAVLAGGLCVVAAPRLAGQTNAAAMLAAGNTDFALDLYARLKGAHGNLFFSPSSISTCLGMTFAGARGNTEKQMARTLHFGLGRAALAGAFGGLQKSWNAAGRDGVKLNSANALWMMKGHPFLPAFLEIAQGDYEANLLQVDFRTHAEPARLEINHWVERRTHDKIKDILAPGTLSAATRLVLVNAIYFKGNWARQFAPRATGDADFWVTAERSVKVPMMHQKASFRHGRFPSGQVLEMPYVGGGLSMFVLLPDERDGLANLEAALTRANLHAWLGSLRASELRVGFPKFKLDAKFDLEKTLPAMGMTDAFTAAADFSGIDGTRQLYISSVTHKAFVEVNEEGTEAAAATATGITMLGISPGFEANHPFVFLIRDNRSGSVLFLGRFTGVQ